MRLETSIAPSAVNVMLVRYDHIIQCYLESDGHWRRWNNATFQFEPLRVARRRRRSSRVDSGVVRR